MLSQRAPRSFSSRGLARLLPSPKKRITRWRVGVVLEAVQHVGQPLLEVHGAGRIVLCHVLKGVFELVARFEAARQVGGLVADRPEGHAVVGAERAGQGFGRLLGGDHRALGHAGRVLDQHQHVQRTRRRLDLGLELQRGQQRAALVGLVGEQGVVAEARRRRVLGEVFVGLVGRQRGVGGLGDPAGFVAPGFAPDVCAGEHGGDAEHRPDRFGADGLRSLVRTPFTSADRFFPEARCRVINLNCKPRRTCAARSFFLPPEPSTPFPPWKRQKRRGRTSGAALVVFFAGGC